MRTAKSASESQFSSWHMYFVCPARTDGSLRAVDIHFAGKNHRGMLALSDSQLCAIWARAELLPVEKRGIFLARVVAQLQLRGSRFTAADLDDVVHSVLNGLIQQSAA